MSFKRILAYQDDSVACHNWTQIAATFAASHGASLTGLNVEEASAGQVAFDTDISSLLQAAQSRVATERDRRIRQQFAKTMKQSAIDYHWRSVAGDAPVMVRRAARFFDLVFTGQPDERTSDIHGGMRTLEHLLVGSGRPVVVIPNGWIAPLEAKRIVIGWDGSREAVRAMQDAMPLLQTADNVTIVTVLSGDERRPTSDSTPSELAALLQAHGIRGSARAVMSEDRRSGKILLKCAAEEQADLLVLGAYGHSRLMGMVLGGVTRHVLRHAVTPVLMSH